MSIISGSIGAGLSYDSSQKASSSQMATSALGLQLQANMFMMQQEMYNKQWDAMQPFIQQEMKKFGYEEAAWKYGLEQQDFGRLQMKFGEEQMGYGREQMGYGREQMKFGKEEMDFAREQMKLGLEQHDFARQQMDLASYGMDAYKGLYEAGPDDFFNSERYQTAMANIDLQRDKNIKSLSAAGNAMGVGGEALAMELEKQMVPYETAALMNEYGNHLADYQQRLGQASAMTGAYGGGSDSYSGSKGAGAGQVSMGGAGGGGNVMSPQSSGAPVTGVGQPNFSAYSSGMANSLANMGASQASGYLGASQAWQQGLQNSLAPLQQIGADYLGSKLPDWLG